MGVGRGSGDVCAGVGRRSKIHEGGRGEGVPPLQSDEYDRQPLSNSGNSMARGASTGVTISE